jgi:hypothetical protein
MIMESRTDARVPNLQSISAIKFLPDLQKHLHFLGGLMQLRSDPVWTILPARVEVK